MNKGLKQSPQLLAIYKKRGDTPLEALNWIRAVDPSYASVSLSYAGRLDPMAEGLLLILVGDEANKKREMFLGMDKTYFFEVLLGFSTDTGDILGKITGADEEYLKKDKKISEERIKNILKKLVGKRSQAYPAYSSRTVGGKPLFEWAREDRLAEIEIPEKEIHIHDLAFVSERSIEINKLRTEIVRDIKMINGDFRQKEISDLWEKELSHIPTETDSLKLFSFRVSCSSGTYVRTLAEDIARALGTKGLAYKIVREKIGSYELPNAQRKEA